MPYEAARQNIGVEERAVFIAISLTEMILHQCVSIYGSQLSTAAHQIDIDERLWELGQSQTAAECSKVAKLMTFEALVKHISNLNQYDGIYSEEIFRFSGDNFPVLST